MSNLSRPLTKEDTQTLQKEFRAALEEFNVASKKDARRMIKEELRKADEASVADEPEEFGDNGDLTAADLREKLPDDVWKVVRPYLAGDGDPMTDADETDVAKTAKFPLLKHVQKSLNGTPSQNPEPSYEPTTKSQESISDTLLGGFYASLEEPREFTKSDRQTESDNPVLRAIDEDLK